jgi:predicted  nucleic acid-binding Zn-ribbon protein
MGQGYADITKLRELAAKHERLSTRNQQRAARINTRIEKIRHQVAVLREKAQMVLGRIPDLEQEMSQFERDIQSKTDRTGGIAVPGSDVTNLQFRIRKLQQKIVDLQHKSRTLEHKAAMKTQRTAELKVKVDRFLEMSKLEEQEGLSYRQRADRLQLATQGEVAARLNGIPAGEAPGAPTEFAGPR